MADPTGQVNVPASTPTIGAVLGGIVAGAVAAKNPNNAEVTYAATTVIPAFIAWLFHFAHSKLGTPE